MKLDKAIELLERSTAVELRNEVGSPVIFPSIDRDDEHFLRLEWEPYRGDFVQRAFAKADNQEIRIDGISMMLKSVEGEEIPVTPLAPLINPQNPLFS